MARKFVLGALVIGIASIATIKWLLLTSINDHNVILWCRDLSLTMGYGIVSGNLPRLNYLFALTSLAVLMLLDQLLGVTRGFNYFWFIESLVTWTLVLCFIECLMAVGRAFLLPQSLLLHRANRSMPD